MNKTNQDIEMAIRQRAALQGPSLLSDVPYYIQELSVKVARLDYKLNKILSLLEKAND